MPTWVMWWLIIAAIGNLISINIHLNEIKNRIKVIQVDLQRR